MMYTYALIYSGGDDAGLLSDRFPSRGGHQLGFRPGADSVSLPDRFVLRLLHSQCRTCKTLFHH